MQILPPKTNLGSELGKSLGQGLQSGLTNSLNRQYEMSMTNQGLSEALAAAKDAKGDPIKLAFAFAKAGAHSPYLERAIGPLYAEALKYSGAGQFPDAINEAVGVSTQGNSTPSTSQNEMQPQGKNPETIPSKKYSPQVEETSMNYLNQVRPDLTGQDSAFGSSVPTFDFSQKSDLRPEEEAKVRKSLLEKKTRPEVIDQVIGKLREDIKTKWNEANTKFGLDATQKQAIQNKWNSVQEIASKRLPVFLERYPQGTQENLQGKYSQYASQQPTNLTPEAIHTNAMALLQKDMNSIDALKAIPAAPPFRNAKEYQTYIKPIAEAYKSLWENGYQQAVREDAIENKDLGIEGMHQAIWGAQTNQGIINQLSSKQPPKEYEEVKSSTYPGSKSYNRLYQKDKEKYVNGLAKDLSKIGPDDDLVLLRGAVLDSGGTIDDFMTALQKSGAELSPFQNSQLQELQIPRQRPLWEIFSKGFKPFLNIIRGKR